MGDRPKPDVAERPRSRLIPTPLRALDRAHARWTVRQARNLSWLFQSDLLSRSGWDAREELGFLAGISRQMANQGLAKLADLGLVEIGHGAITILDLERLARHEG